MSTMPSRVVLEQAGRADRGEDLAGEMVGDDDGHRELRAERRGAVGGERLERRLQVAVDGEAMDRQLRDERRRASWPRWAASIGKALARRPASARSWPPRRPRRR